MVKTISNEIIDDDQSSEILKDDKMNTEGYRYLKKKLTDENKKELILFSFKSLLWIRVWKLLNDLENLFLDPKFSKFFNRLLKNKEEIKIDDFFKENLSLKNIKEILFETKNSGIPAELKDRSDFFKKIYYYIII